MIRILTLIIFLLSLLLAAPADTAGPSAPGFSSQVLKPSVGALSDQFMTPEDKAFLVWKDSERVRVVDGHVRSLRLKPEVKISRAEFFPRYGLGLGLGLDDQMTEAASLSLDKWDLVRSRFTQQYKGLDVLGADFILQEKEDAVTLAVGKVAVGLKLDITPKISESEALEAVIAAVGDEVYPLESGFDNPNVEETPKGQLAVGSKGFAFTPESFRLVYRFRVATKNSFGAYSVDVDAQSGEVVNQVSEIWEADVAIKGETYYNGTQEFMVGKIPVDVLATPPDIRYRLKVESPDIETMGATYDKPVTMEDLTQKKLDLSDIEDSVDDDEDHNFQGPDQKIAAAVHWGVQEAVSFFQKMFVTPEIEPLLSLVFFKNSPTNCAGATPGNPPLLVYRGFEAKSAEKSFPPCVDVATTGHEYTHAVQRLANPGLVYMSETGAIMEGFADIFGMFIRANVEGGPLSWCSEAPLMKGLCSRNFRDPLKSLWKTHDPIFDEWTANPDTFGVTPYDMTFDLHQKVCTREKNDYCGVHKNSTILSHWFYLVVEGGEGKNGHGEDYKVAGIGNKNSAYYDLAYLTMIMMPSTAGFNDVRALSIANAETLYGKDFPEVISVANAWHAVGVGSKYQIDRGCTPQLGASNVENWKTTLECKALPSEVAWEFQVSTNPKFERDVKTVPATSMSMGADKVARARADLYLDASTVYYWQVRGRYGAQTGYGAQTESASPRQGTKGSGGFGGIIEGLGKWLGGSRESPANGSRAPAIGLDPGEEWTDWSPVLSFKTASKKVSPVSPKSGTTPHNPWGGEFSWTSIPGAVEYKVQISPKSSFAANTGDLLEKTTGGLKETFDLKVDKKYYWRVMPVAPDKAWGDWSDIHSFKTALPVAALVSPANGATVHPWSIPLKWKPWKGAVEYRVVVSTNADLTNPLLDETKPKDAVQTLLDAVGTDGPFHWGVTPKGPPPLSEWGGLSKGSFSADYNKTKPEAKYPKGVYPFKEPNYFVWKEVPGALKYQLSICEKKGNCLDPPPMTGEHGGEGAKDLIYWWPGPTYFTNKNGYTWNVTAIGPKDYSGKSSDNVSYDIGPPAPVPISPAHGATNVEYNPTVFQWSCDACSEYGVDEIYLNASSISGGFGKGGYQASHTQATHVLQPDTGYQWKVCARKLPGLDTCGHVSPSFATKSAPKEESKEDEEKGSQGGGKSCPTLSAPTITYPPDNPFWYLQKAIKTPTAVPQIAVQWTAVSGATGYKLTIYTFSGTYTPVGEWNFTGTSSGGLTHSKGIPYMATVKAKNSCNQWGPGGSVQYMFK